MQVVRLQQYDLGNRAPSRFNVFMIQRAELRSREGKQGKFRRNSAVRGVPRPGSSSTPLIGISDK